MRYGGATGVSYIQGKMRYDGATGVSYIQGKMGYGGAAGVSYIQGVNIPCDVYCMFTGV